MQSSVICPKPQVSPGVFKHGGDLKVPGETFRIVRVKPVTGMIIFFDAHVSYAVQAATTVAVKPESVIAQPLTAGILLPCHCHDSGLGIIKPQRSAQGGCHPY